MNTRRSGAGSLLLFQSYKVAYTESSRTVLFTNSGNGSPGPQADRGLSHYLLPSNPSNRRLNLGSYVDQADALPLSHNPSSERVY